jgi:predicted DNA-binding transcriptional regulator AlpA
MATDETPKLAAIGHNGGPPLDDLELDLDPNEIVRREQGRKYFGLGRTQLDEAIKKGTVPRPFPLVEGGRKTGWLGRQVIAHHRRRITAQLELSGLERAHASPKPKRATPKKKKSKEAAAI